MKVIISTIIIFAAAMLIMGIGIIFKRSCLRGSCGEPAENDSGNNTQNFCACSHKKSGSESSTTNRT